MNDYQRRREEQSRRTETAILTAALDLMRQRGFDSVSVRDICTRAGITTGAFYHHFPSKEALFSKGFAPLDEYMRVQLAEYENDPPKKRLEVILSSYVRFMQGSGELVARYYQRRIGDPDMQPMDSSHFIPRAMEENLRQVQQTGGLDANVDTRWLADFCFRHFRGTVIDWLLHHRSYDLEEKVLRDYEMLLAMFTRQTGAPTAR